jgi:thioredoxin reductase (NADPH)
MLTTTIENFPGFPEAIETSDLIGRMRSQAEEFGAEFSSGTVSEVDFSQTPLRVAVDGEWHRTRTAIIATGASAKWLGLDSEARLRGRGVSSCATCDGFFFKDRDVFVVGGGDSAMEEALYLSTLCKTVTVIHRRDELRASDIMADRAFEKNNIEFCWDSIVVDILGENKVEGVRVEDVNTGETQELQGAAVFVAIGHKPNTDLFKGQVALNDAGYVETRKHTMTSADGVFVAGDAHDYRYRQAVTASAEGCKAGIDAGRWLEQLPPTEEEQQVLQQERKR